MAGNGTNLDLRGSVADRHRIDDLTPRLPGRCRGPAPAHDLAAAQMAEAIRYAIARRDIFERFLTDGLIELDSNIVERAIRPQTITRKNSLFAGSDGGGQTWATIATLLQTCRMNNVDPTAWLTQTLERIANQWPNAQIEALMPWNYRP